MAKTSILFLAVFAAICLATLITPMAGVIGYILHYHIAPEMQWWGRQFSGDIRFSATLAGLTVISILLHYPSLRFGNSSLTRHEKLILLFLGMVWLSLLVGVHHETSSRAGGEVDPPEVKLAKVILFAMVITHVVTDFRKLKILMWVLLAGAFYLGVRAYTASPAKFVTGGRLEFIGGPDFHDANALAGHFALLIPIIAVLFVRSGLLGKAVSLVAGVFVVNGLILTRSRGAFVAVAGGMLAALLMAPQGRRKTVLIGLIFVAAGFLRLTDPSFRERASTIAAPAEQRDISVQSRLDIWQGSLTILAKHPLGVGAGNFPAEISQVVPQYARKDAHSTFVLCYTELGIQGFIVLILVIVAACKTLWTVHKSAAAAPPELRADLTWIGYGLAVSLVIVLVRGLTMSRLYTESTWWVLALPVCLLRAMQNASAGPLAAPAETAAKPARRRPSRRPRQPVGLGRRP